MSFFYESHQAPLTHAIDFDRMDATKKFLEHYDNYLILHAFAKTGDYNERHQAEKEIVIARRKMEFWKRRSKFDYDAAMKQVAIKNKQWSDVGHVPPKTAVL